MEITKIPIKQTSYFSSFICDYIEGNKKMTPFYKYFPKLENFKEQINFRYNEKNISIANRKILASVLSKQYESISYTSKTKNNIALLEEESTFTITTGHQLNLFTGPLYFFYKIISTINLCEELSENYPDKNFIPIYWMASEDHDFEEINFFNVKNEKIQWNRSFGGAVGELSTDGLDEVYKQFSSIIGPGKNAKKLKTLFSNAYLNHTNLSDATRYLVNELFGDYGLVILDANEQKLKNIFIPQIEKELLETPTINKVSESSKGLDLVQVNPREINLFYIHNQKRERIIKEEGVYKIIILLLLLIKKKF